MESCAVIDTREAIDYYALRVARARLKLETIGMRSRKNTLAFVRKLFPCEHIRNREQAIQVIDKYLSAFSEDASRAI